jgi:hypothetical protein
MDTTPEPSSPLDEFMKRAERMASGAEHHIPSWLRPGDPESRLPVLVALIAVIGLQLAIPKSYTVVPRWPLITLELLLMAVLTWLNPLRLTNATRLGRYATWVLLAAITLDNTLSAILLDIRILSGEVSNKAAVLLGSGGAIFVTNSSCSASGTGNWTAADRSPGARANTPTRISCFRKWIPTPPNSSNRDGGRRSSTTCMSA